MAPLDYKHVHTLVSDEIFNEETKKPGGKEWTEPWYAFYKTQ